ncbi:MAG: DUF3592 domain-containing protein [Acidobacteria bacterium]|nr:DUF3592 domain-containing protein [Acidobacteriota bacterium]
MSIPVFQHARRSILFWFASFFLFFGVLLLITGLSNSRQAARDQQELRPARAVVLNKSIRHATRTGNARSVYLITYRFRDPKGASFERTAVVGAERWEELAQGGEIGILYRETKPSDNRVESESEPSSGAGELVSGFLFTAAGGTMYFLFLRRFLRHWRLLRIGKTVEATVLAVEATNVEVNGVKQCRVRYRYQDEYGRWHQGASWEMPPKEARRWKANDPIAVRVDPANPQESVFAPAPAAAPPKHKQVRSVGRRILSALAWVGRLLLVLIAIAVAQSIPFAGTLERFLQRRESLYTGIAIGVMVLGLGVFLGSLLLRMVLGGPSHEEFSFKGMKDAFRTGRWREPVWRWRLAIVTGAAVMGFGIASLIFIVAAGGIKLLVLAAVLYVLIRTGIGMARA